MKMEKKGKKMIPLDYTSNFVVNIINNSYTIVMSFCFFDKILISFKVCREEKN